MAILFTTTVADNQITTVDDHGNVAIWHRSDNEGKFDAWLSATLSLHVLLDPASYAAYGPDRDHDDSKDDVNDAYTDDPEPDEEIVSEDAGDLGDEEWKDDTVDDSQKDNAEHQPSITNLTDVEYIQLSRQFFNHARILQRAKAALVEGSFIKLNPELYDTYVTSFEQGYIEAIMLLRVNPGLQHRDDLLDSSRSVADIGWAYGYNHGISDFKTTVMHEQELERLGRIAAAHALADTQGYGASSPIYGHTTPVENRDDPSWHVNMSADEIEKFVLDEARMMDTKPLAATLFPTSL